MVRKVTFILGLFTVALAAIAQPSNDACINSTPIAIPASGNICVNGTLAGATDDGIYSTCENAGSNEVWFTYITNGSNNTITVSPTGGTPATNLVVSLTSTPCTGNTINTFNPGSVAVYNATYTVKQRDVDLLQ